MNIVCGVAMTINFILCMCAADINESFFRQEAEMIMANLFKQTKFEVCQGYLQSSLADSADIFGRLKAAANSLCRTAEATVAIKPESESIEFIYIYIFFFF